LFLSSIYIEVGASSSFRSLVPPRLQLLPLPAFAPTFIPAASSAGYGVDSLTSIGLYGMFADLYMTTTQLLASGYR
jgi:hypothetical protein